MIGAAPMQICLVGLPFSEIPIFLLVCSMWHTCELYASPLNLHRWSTLHFFWDGLRSTLLHHVQHTDESIDLQFLKYYVSLAESQDSLLLLLGTIFSIYHQPLMMSLSSKNGSSFTMELLLGTILPSNKCFFSLTNDQSCTILNNRSCAS